tara:strand:+ start:413 stop:592 length:180 start_codon:yes stop_codon:yes gene_type:complete
MGFLDKVLGGGSGKGSANKGIIDYGEAKKDGSHDHRYNKGPDRTTAQKAADSKKKDSQE